ncbi:hypothetical protein DVH26_33840 [Paenibacillus sp. H1-7]|uniref:hypothetical protein n=1 Tax=Paenibacillus sp. H1-7 TaxID=2282849 RepID=UPI001EF7E552|nr:hypothetical protein [Paenibacillus sp. H1-7]ULL18981.1 hypothetical protein DVH26_33840 [Paenibacillus sp. H1-7]
MILYQMAKRMEQRQHLHRTIKQSEGNTEQLIVQKEQVEEQLMSQAHLWKESGNDEFQLNAWVPEALWTESNQPSLL